MSHPPQKSLDRPPDCRCGYPVTLVRNLTGHGLECPAHHRLLAEAYNHAAAQDRAQLARVRQERLQLQPQPQPQHSPKPAGCTCLFPDGHYATASGHAASCPRDRSFSAQVRRLKDDLRPPTPPERTLTLAGELVSRHGAQITELRCERLNGDTGVVTLTAHYPLPRPEFAAPPVPPHSE